MVGYLILILDGGGPMSLFFSLCGFNGFFLYFGRRRVTLRFTAGWLPPNGKGAEHGFNWKTGFARARPDWSESP
jgi:hypothetical protein